MTLSISNVTTRYDDIVTLSLPKGNYIIQANIIIPFHHIRWYMSINGNIIGSGYDIAGHVNAAESAIMSLSSDTTIALTSYLEGTTLTAGHDTDVKAVLTAIKIS